jgi:hypothetical protein
MDAALMSLELNAAKIDHEDRRALFAPGACALLTHFRDP